MPVELFEYRGGSRPGDRAIVHDLVAQGPAGGEFVERWTFEGGEFCWGLEADQDGKPTRIMGGAYRRAGAKP